MYTPDTQATVHLTREAWLVAARDILIAERFAPVELMVQKTRVSVGFPVGRNRNQRIGECHYEESSKDQTRELFISPVLDDPLGVNGVLSTLMHELLHAALPARTGHRGKFVTGMRKLDLVGRPTSAGASASVLEWFAVSLLPRLGRYPHAALHATQQRSGQRNRHRKYVCPDCDQIIRAAGSTLNVICGDCDVTFVEVAN